MDPIQIVIIAVSVVLTSLFIALGIQFWFILKEVRLSMQKVNHMLDDACKVTGVVGEGAENVQGLVNGLKTGLAIVSSIRKKGEDNE